MSALCCHLTESRRRLPPPESAFGACPILERSVGAVCWHARAGLLLLARLRHLSLHVCLWCGVHAPRPWAQQHQLRTDRRVRSEVSRYQQLEWCITGQALSVCTRWAPALQRRGVCRVSQPSHDAASATRVPLAKPPSSHGIRKHESLGAVDGGRGSCADAKLRGMQPRVGPTLGSEGVSARSRPRFEPARDLASFAKVQLHTNWRERESTTVQTTKTYMHAQVGEQVNTHTHVK